MPSTRLFFLPILLIVASAGCTAPVAPVGPVDPGRTDGFWVIGYHPWWLSDAWEQADYSVLRQVLFFDLPVEADGTLADERGWPSGGAYMASRLQARGTSLMPTVSMFDADAFVRLFGDPAAVERLRTTLMGMVETPGVAGLHLDFEVFAPVPPGVRDAFTAFVADLRAALDEGERRRFLSLYSLAFDVDDAYDEAALAPLVDYFVVQGYDFHWLEDETAGPVAPLQGWDGENWESVVRRYLDLGVPRHKIVMSVPYYGYEWPTESEAPGAATRGPGRILTYAPVPNAPGLEASARERARRHGLRRDPSSGSPYYAYRTDDGWHQGWFEDAESLAAKYEFVRREGLGGVAVFPLGYDDADLAGALADAFSTDFRDTLSP